MDTEQILERLYGKSVRQRSLISGVRRSLRRMRYRISDGVIRNEIRLVLFSIAFASWVVGHIYYYNMLIVLDYDVQAAEAQIDVAKQKRSNIQRNLTRLLRYYERYEQAMMKEVTAMRVGSANALSGEPKPKQNAKRSDASANDTASGDESAAASSSEAAAGATENESLETLLMRFNAVAEQYPNLHLTKSATQFSDAVVNSENEIAARISEYNMAVNLYTTALNTFPASIFAKTLGFEDVPFYEIDDPSRQEYRELDL